MESAKSTSMENVCKVSLLRHRDRHGRVCSVGKNAKMCLSTTHHHTEDMFFIGRYVHAHRREGRQGRCGKQGSREVPSTHQVNPAKGAEGRRGEGGGRCVCVCALVKVKFVHVLRKPRSRAPRRL